MEAIPTKYKGIQFRSRLEARWAAMFDLLRWNWIYEPYDLNGWIPDFEIVGNKSSLLVEVKPFSQGIQWDAVKAEIEKSGIDDRQETLLIGTGLIETDCHDIAIGWLGEVWDCGGRSYCPAQIVCGCPFGINSVYGAWFDRISGVGGKGTTHSADANEIQNLWSIACNNTQWRPR